MLRRTSIIALVPLLAACSTHLRTAQPVERTSPPPSPIAAADSALFFLDGVEIRPADSKLIDPAKIATIDHLRGPAAMSLYGPRSRAGVIQIASKVAPSPVTSMAQLYLLDGREIPVELVRVLDVARINTVEVLKGPAARAYGSRALDAVVLITSKAG